MKKTTIGLFGLGCVGQGLLKILAKKSEQEITVKRICINDPRKERPVDGELLTTDPEDIFRDREINLVVEVISEVDAAFRIVKRALQEKIPVVSANKKMIALHFEELRALAEEHKTPFLYEGAVCGAIPVLRTVDQYFKLDEISRIEGIFNGTTNYILTSQHAEDVSFSDVLAEAQEKGFAELDASADVDAYDPKYKLKIMLAHAYGLEVPAGDILNLGIGNIRKEDVQYAKSRGMRFKLLSIVNHKDNLVNAFVMPVLVQPKDFAYHVDFESNFVEIKTEFAVNHQLVGKGAGSTPTGIAVYADVMSIHTTDYHYSIPESNGKVFSNDVLVELFISADNSEVLSSVHLEEVYREFASQGYFYKTGVAKLSDLQSLQGLPVFAGLVSKRIIIPKREELLATVS